MNGPEWHEKFADSLEQAKRHVRFCVELMREQLAAGRHFLFEHPAWASSWDMPELQSLADTPGVLWQKADQCMYGLTSPDDDGIDTPAKKPTGFLSSSWCILEELSVQCDHAHEHQHLMGGRASAAALYSSPYISLRFFEKTWMPSHFSLLSHGPGSKSIEAAPRCRCSGWRVAKTGQNIFFSQKVLSQPAAPRRPFV